MAWLISRVGPYALIVLGLAGLGGLLKTAITGPEEAPTPLAIEGIKGWDGDRSWVQLKAGVLYFPGGLIDESRNEKTNARSIKAWYVPYLEPKTAAAMTLSTIGGKEPKQPERLVYVKFTPDQFLSVSKGFDEKAAGTWTLAREVRGLRFKESLWPKRFKDFLRAEVKIAPQDVRVFEFEKEPTSRESAVSGSLVSLLLVILGARWYRKRQRDAAAQRAGR